MVRQKVTGNSLENCKIAYKFDEMDAVLWIVFGGIIYAIWHFAGPIASVVAIIVYLAAIFATGMKIWNNDLDEEEKKEFWASPFWDTYILIFYGWFLWISDYELSKEESKRDKSNRGKNKLNCRA